MYSSTSRPPDFNKAVAKSESQITDLNGIYSYSFQANYVDAAPAVTTFDSATYEVQTLTFAAKAATTHQDLVIVSNAAGLSFAVALTKPVAEVQTLTFADKATTVHQDFVILSDASGLEYAVALTKPVAEVQTLTVPAGAGAAASRDFVILTDGSGLTWATYFDTSGTDIAPTAAAYTAVNAARKIKTDITGLAANTDIVTAMTSALNGLTGFTAAITLSGTTTLIATMAVKAPCANPVIFAEDGIAAATAFSGAETTAGVASTAPAGILWTAIAGARKGLADISGDTTAAQVAARVETALNALTGFTAAITTDDTANDGTMTLTQVVKAPTTNPVPKDAAESGAGTITGVQTTAGVESVAPAGALWTAVAGARKGLADISADTSAADVAARVETALNALTGFTASITTDDTANDGTMTLTQVVAGPTTNAVPKNAAEAGAGSIGVAETTTGLVTELGLTTEYITIPSHPYVTGTKVALTTAGTLPTGLSATNYWVINVDVNTISLAASLADAAAGTPVNMTGEGTGVHTLTPATSTSNVLKLQKSNDATNWTDISSMTVTIATTTGTSLFEVVDPSYRYLKILYTPSAGQINLTSYLNVVRM